MDALTARLQSSRDAFHQCESERDLVQRDVEHQKQSLKEILALCELEQRNLQTTRTRLNELKEELSSLQDLLLSHKEAAAKEEHKLRVTKSIAGDQLRLLQVDLTKLQGECKTQQKAIAEMERHQRNLEEEAEIRKRDLDNELTALRSQIEDGETLPCLVSL